MGTSDKKINGDGTHTPAEDVLAGLDFAKKPSVSVTHVHFVKLAQPSHKFVFFFLSARYVTRDANHNVHHNFHRHRGTRARRDQHQFPSHPRQIHLFFRLLQASGTDSGNETPSWKR